MTTRGSARPVRAMVKTILILGAISVVLPSSATARVRLAIRQCVADLGVLCPESQPGDGLLRICLRDHLREVSFSCLVTLAKFAEVRGFRQECSAHLRQQCAGVAREQLGTCLSSAVASLSDDCQDTLARAIRRPR